MDSMCVMCAVPGAPESSGGFRRAEALGRTAVLPAVQPEIQSHPAAAFPRLLLQSGRDAPQVGNRHFTNRNPAYCLKHCS